MTRTLVILNPGAGGADEVAGRMAVIREHPALEDGEIRRTGEAGDARTLARRAAADGVERVVAAGGDGTVNGVVTGLLEEGRGAVLGVLPMGTGNDLARSLGIPLELDGALDVLAEATPVSVDLVRMTGSADRWFANASAGGLSGRVDEGVTPDLKAVWGPLAYIRSALEFVSELPTWRVTLETGAGETWEGDALNVLVANGRTVAGGIPVAPEARLDDGLLDVVVVRTAGLPALAAFASRCLVESHLDHELVEHRVVRSLSVASEPPMTFNVDGELVGETPFSYEVRPGALQVLPGPDAPGLGGR